MKHSTKPHILILALFLLLPIRDVSCQSGAATLTSGSRGANVGRHVASRSSELRGQDTREERKDVELMTNCGGENVEKTETLKIPAGYVYVKHQLEYIFREPPDKPDLAGCKDSWDPDLQVLKVICRCVVQKNECKKKEDGTWNDRASKLKVRIHLSLKLKDQ